jgi:hypothetical protein
MGSVVVVNEADRLRAEGKRVTSARLALMDVVREGQHPGAATGGRSGPSVKPMSALPPKTADVTSAGLPAVSPIAVCGSRAQRRHAGVQGRGGVNRGLRPPRQAGDRKQQFERHKVGHPAGQAHNT